VAYDELQLHAAAAGILQAKASGMLKIPTSSLNRRLGHRYGRLEATATPIAAWRRWLTANFVH
jgi:hypothetical protein